MEANDLGKKYKSQRRSNWDEIKVDVLYSIVLEKVNQHSEVRDALLATGDEEIIEVNPHDDFWGSGPDGKGQDQTGKLLMKIRDEIC